MSRRISLLIVLLFLCALASNVSATPVTDTTGATFASSGSITTVQGMRFVTKYANLPIVSITKDAGCTATRAILQDNTGATLGTATFSGDTATFSSPVNCTGAVGTTCRAVVDNSGATFTRTWATSAPLGFPKAGTNINYTGYDDAGVFNTNLQSICIVSVTSDTAPVLSGATLYVNAYYADGTVSQSFNLGTLQNNYSYDFGFTATKTNSTFKRTVVTFNGTALYDSEVSYSGAAYPFNTNSSCSDAGQTCAYPIVYGANPVLNSTSGIVGAWSTVNGTIDEVLTATTASAGVTEKGDAAFLIAYGKEPTVAYGGTYVSNLYAPAVQLQIIPSNPVYTDDLLGRVNYTDGDSGNGSIVIEWRVNGTKVRSITIAANNNEIQSDALYRGNYSMGATVNLTAWACDSLYCSSNSSLSVVIGGQRPDPVTSLLANYVNKTTVSIGWTNPGGYQVKTAIYLNGSFVANVSNTTTNASITGLLPDNDYLVTLYAISADDTYSDSASVGTSTSHNPAPTINTYTPSNTTQEFDEDTTQEFNVNATDDDGNPLVAWFKDNVLEAFGSAWTWVVGKNEQGTHTITAVANDSYGASSNVTWTVTVLDTYPAPNTPTFSPNGGSYRTYIPVKCVSTNAKSSINYYDLLYRTNGGAWQNLSMNNLNGYLQFDITQYNYSTTFEFTCNAYGDSGNATATSAVFTRDYVNEFYATTKERTLSFTSLEPYEMSLYYDVQKPNSTVSIEYTYADCNGDDVYDYVYNYNGSGATRVKQYYTCVFNSGRNTLRIGAFIKKNSGDTWQGTGCNQDYQYSNTCLVTKSYTFSVGRKA